MRFYQLSGKLNSCKVYNNIAKILSARMIMFNLKHTHTP